ncbi:hypothetical protein DAEQUDRAFT_309370 [Daedalea quercina L-15889]|uniref:Uncharacterized protein n=1 Tax=Daedalea quercina L-15889 TaxID=1314783 RepID=A0A165PYD2_9APHY|nr:hypothetical protein DAEQUDRAFT_309370 [Daedalea quercina L-15889]
MAMGASAPITEGTALLDVYLHGADKLAPVVTRPSQCTCAHRPPGTQSQPPAPSFRCALPRRAASDTVRAISMAASVAPPCGSQAQIWQLRLSPTPGEPAQKARNRDLCVDALVTW